MSFLGNSPATVARTDFTFIATSGQTVFSGNDSNNLILSFDANNFDVFVNGVLLNKTDYTGGGTGVTLTVPRNIGDIVTIRSYGIISSLDNSIANTALQPSTGVYSVSTVAAISTTRIPSLINIFYVKGFSAEGDGGGHYRTRISTPTSPTAWQKQSGDGSWWDISSGQMIYPEMFGAKGDNSADDSTAIQNALNYSLLVYFRNKNYVVNGSLTWQPKHQLLGTLKVNGSSTSNTGGTRLIFTGNANSCFIQANNQIAWTYGGIRGITVRSTGNYPWMIDIYSPISFFLEDSELQTTNTSTSGLRSQKINSTDSSWTNLIRNSNITLPSGSTGRVLQHDWSDSRVEYSYLSGGYGTIDYGYGTEYHGCNIERSYDAGITLSKQLTNVQSILIGNYFDANANCGIKVDVSNDPQSSQPYVQHIVVGNGFRTVHPDTGVAGTADIILVGNDSIVYAGGTYVGNSGKSSAVPPISYVSSQWKNITYNAGYTLYPYSPVANTANDNNFIAAYNGLNIPNGPSILKGYANIYSQTGVSLHAGAPTGTGNGAGIQLGSINGTSPFIGASLDSANTATSLTFNTGGTGRMVLDSAGTYLRPSSNVTFSLGTTTYRYLGAYLNRLYLTAGISEPSVVANSAILYVDSADGSLKVKFASGTVKTITTNS